MNHQAMEPYGAALLAYYQGDTNATLLVRRDDGQETPLPIRHFFRPPSEFTPLETAALDHCRGRILDVGAGTGLHSLVLQEKGFAVTAIDISPLAVDIMKRRGVRDVRCADILHFHEEVFDTLLLMGHGIGMMETIRGLDDFLKEARRVLSGRGQILADSLDVRATDDPANLSYHQSNRALGRYVGETRIQFQFQEMKGPYCGWLHVDSQTLSEHAQSNGWDCTVLIQQPDGNYLACLTPLNQT